MGKKITILAMLWLASLGLKAQDPHFSQFNAAPLQLNPALAGFFEGDYRVAASYRGQWGSFTNVFRSAAASFEMSVLKGKMVDNNLAFGISFLNDAAGPANFGRNGLVAAAAYKRALGGYRTKHTLAVGVSLGFLQDKVDGSKLTFDNQYNGISFDPTIAPSVVVNGSSFGFDLNAGLLYQIIPSEHANYYFGGSVSHIIGPKMNLIGGSSYQVLPRYTGHFGAKVEINNFFNILPSAMYQQEGASREVVFGTYAQFIFDYLNDAETAFAIGLWGRISEITPDATIVGARLDFQHFTVGASYDFNVSKLSEVSHSRGAYEVSLIYTGNFVTRGKRRLSIPCPQL